MRLEKPRLEPLSGLRRAFSYLEGRVTAMDVVLDTANDTDQEKKEKEKEKETR